jgi:hypothetical protein
MTETWCGGAFLAERLAVPAFVDEEESMRKVAAMKRMAVSAALWGGLSVCRFPCPERKAPRRVRVVRDW